MRFALAVCVAVGCAHPPHTGPPRYRDERSWLCLPGRAGDACAGDLTATELRADGTRIVIPDPPITTDPPVDCFYVYPTAYADPVARNQEDFSNLGPLPAAALVQIGQLRTVCRVYAPLYRQASAGTYALSRQDAEPYLAVAFADVAAAFQQYLRLYNHGRRVVLIGHSQGGEMVARLVRRFFDDDPRLRAQLLYAFVIGARVEVREGATTDGDFATVPMCTRRGETGCVVAFKSYAAGHRADPGGDAPEPGMTSICVNPAGDQRLARAWFPTSELRGLDGVTTPFVALPDFYTARCADGGGGFRYLEIGVAPGDPRVNPIDFEAPQWTSFMGLHLLDLELAQGDLLGMIAEASR